jgi:hypothetical protein
MIQIIFGIITYVAEGTTPWNKDLLLIGKEVSRGGGNVEFSESLILKISC